MSNKKDKYIKHGSVLAITSILVRIIGMLYRIPMTDIIGDRGNGLYAGAFEMYNIILLISTYSMPMAVSKVVSHKMATRDYLNSYRFFKVALAFSLATGTFFSCFAFFGSDFLAGTLLKSPMSAIALRVLAPTILVVSVMGVIRGFFQATGSMIPTSISQIIEQLVNAVVSVVAAKYLFDYGLKIAKATGNDDFSYAYGAAGGTLGTFLGAVSGFLFLLFIVLMYVAYLKKLIKKQEDTRMQSKAEMLEILVMTILPVILSTAVYNVNSILSQGIYYHTMFNRGISASVYESTWGIYSGKYKLLCNVPIAIASSMAASIVPVLSVLTGRKASNFEINKKIGNTVKMVMLVIIPCVIGLTVLSHPIINMLFRSDAASQKLAGDMLLYGSISVLFIALSTLSTGFLQGMSKMKEPVINSFISLVLQLILFKLLLNFKGLDIFAMIIANIFFAFMVSLLNGLTLRRHTGYRQEMISTFILPAISSLLMGVVAFGSYKLSMILLHRNTLSVIISIIFSVAAYFVFIIKFHAVTKEELMQFPKGNKMVRLGEKLRLW